MQINSSKKCSEKMDKKGQKRAKKDSRRIGRGLFAFFLFAGSVYFGGGRIMKGAEGMKYITENERELQV